MRRPTLAFLILSLLPSAYAQATPPGELNGARAVSRSMTFPAPANDPVAASNGSEFFAAWADDRFGDRDSVGARYTAGGAMVDPHGIPLVATYTRDWPSALVSNGTDYALFAATGLGTTIARVDSEGAVHGGGTIEAIFPLAAAWNGSRYAVAFRTQQSSMQLRFFDANLGQHGSVTFAPAKNDLPYAAVAANGGRFLVVWDEWNSQDPGGQHRLRMQLFDDGGTPLSEARDLLARTVQGSTGASAPAVSANATGFVVTWTELQSIAGAAVSLAGEVTNTFAISTSLSARGTDIAWDGSSHLVVWWESWNNTYEAARVSASAEVTARFTLPVFTTVGATPAVASNGRIFLVIAGDRRLVVDAGSDAKGRDIGPVSLAWVPQDSPVVTAGSSHLLVSWFEGGRVWARKILPDGSPLVTFPGQLDLGEGASYGSSNAMTSASAANDLHLVAWRSAPQNRTRAALIGTNGVAPVELPSSAGYPRASASDGRSFALAWYEYATPQPSEAISLVIATIGQDGNVTTHTVAPSTWGVEVRTLGWTGSEYALVWRRYLSPPCHSAFCSRTFEERLTLLSADGVTKSERILVAERSQSGIISAVVEADGVMLVSVQPATTTASGSVTTQRFAFDGSASDPVTTSGFTWTFPASAQRLVKTPGGYTLLMQSIEYGAMVEWRGELHAILIEQGGRVTQDVTLTDAHVFGGAVHAFGNTWITYTARWKPLPEAHGGTVARAFYRPLPIRTRAIRR